MNEAKRSKLDAPDGSGPSSIYLQWHGDGEPDDTGEVSAGDVTWCADPMFPLDIRYVRWDLVEHLLTDIMASHTDPCSPYYNECETEEERCVWCHLAAALYPPNAKAQP